MSDVKKVKVVMLPSKQASIIGKFKYPQGVNKLCIYPKPISENNGDGNGTIPRHLYFLSDEEIKEGDWYLNGELLFKADSVFNEGNNPNNSNPRVTDFNKKIIATTDKSLKIIIPRHNDFDSEYSLPEPSKEFIEVYVKAHNESAPITEVLVEYDSLTCLSNECYRKITCDECEHSYKILHVRNNTITIKKVKESWSREEVEHLLFKLAGDMWKADTIFVPGPLNKWIEQNL